MYPYFITYIQKERSDITAIRGRTTEYAFNAHTRCHISVSITVSLLLCIK